MASVSSERIKVKGVNFVVDEDNEKKAVIIDLKKHRALCLNKGDVGSKTT